MSTSGQNVKSLCKTVILALMTRTRQNKNKNRGTNKTPPETAESKDTKKPKLIKLQAATVGNPSLGERGHDCIPPGSAPGGQDPSRLRGSQQNPRACVGWHYRALRGPAAGLHPRPRILSHSHPEGEAQGGVVERRHLRHKSGGETGRQRTPQPPHLGSGAENQSAFLQFQKLETSQHKDIPGILPGLRSQALLTGES